MTTQKQLSHLSFAAIILVFAALPALAQTRSVEQTTVVTTSILVEPEKVGRSSQRPRGHSDEKSPIVVAPTGGRVQKRGTRPSVLFCLSSLFKNPYDVVVVILNR
jgi:hypothetical protein